MRMTAPQGLLLPLVVGLALPSFAHAQRNTGTSSSQRTMCASNDSVRSVRRAIGDTARMRRTAGVTSGVGGAVVTGGTPRSQQYPEYDVVLDIPNVCVGKIFLKVDSVTARLALTLRWRTCCG